MMPSNQRGEKLRAARGLNFWILVAGLVGRHPAADARIDVLAGLTRVVDQVLAGLHAGPGVDDPPDLVRLAVWADLRPLQLLGRRLDRRQQFGSVW